MEKILGCIHCGLCLPACPTYQQTGNENDSPRGRIYLMRAVAEGNLSLEAPALSRHLDLCLGCRACETACPAGVDYGHLLESARESLREQEEKTGPIRGFQPQKKLLALALGHVFPYPARLRIVFGLLRFVRGSFLVGGLLRGSWLRRLAAPLDFSLSLLASTRPPAWLAARDRAQSGNNLAQTSADRQPVAVFTGCVMEGLFRETNQATARVLAVNQCQPVEVPTQVCCGALHAHAGDLSQARQLARRNIDAFDAFLHAQTELAGASPATPATRPTIIINAAGCGALLKEYGKLLADDPGYAERAATFSRHVEDVTEFLARRGLVAGAEIGHSVTLDAPCHLYHAQRVTTAPEKVLKAIPGLDYRPLTGSQDCCGGAGIYNLSEPEMSASILAEKIGHVRTTGASVLATANPGCQMQLAAGVRLHGADCQVVHVVDLLDESYARAGHYRQ
jgi:glycolate oxidase iron-sulfur subunit